jgi:glucosamine kinase
MDYFLGIDGGGTSTRCAVGSAEAELGRAAGPTCKLARVGEEGARATLREVISEACHAAGISPRQIARTVVGASGAGNAAVAKRLRTIVGGIVGGEIEVAGDMVIAREAAFPGAPGVIVIAGTGSIAYGRNAKGKTARAGGWGPLLSDEGSGEWIGRAAMRAALRAFDEGDTTRLFGALWETFQVRGRDEMVAALNAAPPPEFASLFPRVLAAADDQDVVATRVLDSAGRELARLAQVVLCRLWPASAPVAVAMCGGVFCISGLVRQSFRETLLAERPGVTVLDSPVEPVAGALSLARRAPARVR